MGEEAGAAVPAPTGLNRTRTQQLDLGLDQDLDLNRRPIVPVINEDHLRGTALTGRVPNQVVFAARMRYYQAQRASFDNLARYLNAADDLITVMQRMVATHREPR